MSEEQKNETDKQVQISYTSSKAGDMVVLTITAEDSLSSGQIANILKQMANQMEAVVS